MCRTLCQDFHGPLPLTLTAARGGCDHCREPEAGRAWRSHLLTVTQLRVGIPLPQGPKEAGLTLTTGSAEGGGTQLEWRKGRLEGEGRLSCDGGAVGVGSMG